MNQQDLKKQIDFIVEIDQLKHIFRQTILPADKRRENDAEHSWHLSIMALLLVQHAADPDLDLLRVIKMLLIHDIVEIDAGDTFAYDEAVHADKEEREQAAADRLFGLLPPEQATELRTLWDEFEDRQSPEAKYAAALDRLQPLLLNFQSGGQTWLSHGVKYDQVIARNCHIEEGAPALWEYARAMIDEAVELGRLEK
jgi:putative hydrolase of HD superfamily